MPVRVNAEALRIVVRAAKATENNLKNLGVKDLPGLEEGELNTSIWMCEQVIEEFDNAAGRDNV